MEFGRRDRTTAADVLSLADPDRVAIPPAVARAFFPHVAGSDRCLSPREAAAVNAVLLNYRFQSWPLATARLAFVTRDESLELEVFAAVHLTHYEGEPIDWALRPMALWRATDALRLRLGGEWFRGADRGVFGAIR
jgi:hypothetical protein